MILKLKRSPGIYLVGFMGSGKSTIGRLLAYELGWHFSDIDDEIEDEERRSISDIFETDGESHFREIEAAGIRKRVRNIQSGKPTVVALGGGTFVQEDNYELLSNNGVSIWLDCPLDVIRKRLTTASHRPLAKDAEKLEQLYHSRREKYSRADFRIDVMDDDSNKTVADILQLPLF